MQSQESVYRACWDRPWFFELDLKEALLNASVALLNGIFTEPRKEEERLEHKAVDEVVSVAYYDRIDLCMFEVAVDAAVNEHFEDKTIIEKVSASLQKCRPAALESALALGHTAEEDEKVITF